MTKDDPAFDTQEYAAAVGDAILAWQSVEYSLYRIFCEALEHANTEVLSNVFVGAAHFRTRMAITEAAVVPQIATQKDHLQTWTSLRKKANRNATDRNRIAHGHRVAVVGDDKGKFKSGFYSVVSPFRPNAKITENQAYSVKKLRECQKSFEALASEIDQFLVVFESIKQPPSTDAA